MNTHGVHIDATSQLYKTYAADVAVSFAYANTKVPPMAAVAVDGCIKRN